MQGSHSSVSFGPRTKVWHPGCQLFDISDLGYIWKEEIDTARWLNDQVICNSDLEGEDANEVSAEKAESGNEWVLTQDPMTYSGGGLGELLFHRTRWEIKWIRCATVCQVSPRGKNSYSVEWLRHRQHKIRRIITMA